MDRRCHFCGGRLRTKARPQAIYCSESCGQNSNRYYRQLAKLPSALQVFQLWVERYAPPDAVSYRVGIDVTRTRILYFPPSDRLSPRWDGTVSARGYFRLCPFEPPIVPKVGVYGFQFFGPDGEELETPLRLVSGVRLVPLLDVELEGDQWKPSGRWFNAPGHHPARLSRGLR